MSANFMSAEQKKLINDYIALPQFIRNWEVIMSNDLVRLPHDFTITQKRLIGLAIANIRADDRKAGNGKTLKLRTSHYAQCFGLLDKDGNTPKSIYKDLKKACIDFIGAKTTIKQENKKEKRVKIFNWVESVEYKNVFEEKEENRNSEFYDENSVDEVKYGSSIQITFTETILSYLLELNKNYTKYNLFISHSLKGIYSIRIYELLQTRKDTNMLIMSITDFRKTLAIPDSYNITNIRTKIMEGVKEELNLKLNMGFDFSITRHKSYDGGSLVKFWAKENDSMLQKYLNNFLGEQANFINEDKLLDKKSETEKSRFENWKKNENKATNKPKKPKKKKESKALIVYEPKTNKDDDVVEAEFEEVTENSLNNKNVVTVTIGNNTPEAMELKKDDDIVEANFEEVAENNKTEEDLGAEFEEIIKTKDRKLTFINADPNAELDF